MHDSIVELWTFFANNWKRTETISAISRTEYINVMQETFLTKNFIQYPTNVYQYS